MAVKPSHKPVEDYYGELERYADHQVSHEGAVRTAFQNLLTAAARSAKWTLIPELRESGNGHTVVPDATLRDEFNMPRGYWEAKDTGDAM